MARDFGLTPAAAGRYGFVVFLVDSGRHHMLGLQPGRAQFGRWRWGRSRKASSYYPGGSLAPAVFRLAFTLFRGCLLLTGLLYGLTVEGKKP